jgi:hypothetical protein
MRGSIMSFLYALQYVDGRGNFHVLAHIYTTRPFPVAGNPVSGHAFSPDGLR